MEREIDDMDGANYISPTNGHMPSKEMEKTQTFSSMEKTAQEGGAPSATDNASMVEGYQTSRQLKMNDKSANDLQMEEMDDV